MPTLRELVAGPWRAAPILGLTLLIGWGAVYYIPVLVAPAIAAEHGWSLAFTMGGVSLGLLLAGLCSPLAGRMVDRFGGRAMLTFGSLLTCLGVVLLLNVSGRAAYLATWVVIGVAMAFSLTDIAFATLTQIFGMQARRPMTAIMLVSGFGATVNWPLAHALMQAHDWRAPFVASAVLLLTVAVPLHLFALPRVRLADASASTAPAATPGEYLPPSGRAFALVLTGFAALAFVPFALLAHMIGIFQRAGIDAGTAVLIGTLFGPAQVASRFLEFVFSRRLDPLWATRLALVAMIAGFVLVASGISVVTAAAFAIAMGAANGIVTVTRGSLPLTMFGARGYGALLGRLGGPYLMVQAAAPVTIALVVQHGSDLQALAVIAAFAAVALACFMLLQDRRPAMPRTAAPDTPG